MATTQDEQAKVTLYWLNNSRAQRIVWLLEELQIKYNVETFHRDKQTMLAPPELKKIHPLGKSPVVSVTAPAGPGLPESEEERRIVLAESGWMSEYLVNHFPQGSKLIPKKWRDGMEGKVGGETAEWLRYYYYLYYVEGSLMPILVFSLIVMQMKGGSVPFFVRPITSVVANRIFSMFLFPNAQKHMAMIEQHLGESTGDYICGNHLTAADILLSYPLLAAKDRLDHFGTWDGKDGKWANAYPKVKAYVDRLEQEPGCKRSVEKIVEIEGKFTGYTL